MPLQVSQGGLFLRFQLLYFHPAAVMLCQTAQLPQGFESRLKNLLPAGRFSQQRNCDGPGLPQQHSQRPSLLGVKIGKPINKNILSAHIAGIL